MHPARPLRPTVRVHDPRVAPEDTPLLHLNDQPGLGIIGISWFGSDGLHLSATGASALAAALILPATSPVTSRLLSGLNT